MSRHSTNHEPVIDFAFADTVVAADLDEAVPPSGVVLQSNGTVYVQDDAAIGAHCIVPLGYPIADAPPSSPPGAYVIQDPSFYAEQQHHQQQQHHQAPLGEDDESLWLRMRANVKASQDEMRLLWGATANLQEVHDGRGAIVHDPSALGRAATISRRVATLFSFFEWDRADVLRAAWIGVAVFVLAATVGAIMLQS